MKPIILNLDTNIDTREYIEMMQGYDYTLECNIFSEGASLDLSAYAVTVEMVQGNKKAFIVQTENITIEGNKATVVLDKDFTNSFGDGGLQIVLTQNGRVNGSWLINCIIKISALARSTDTQSKVDIDASLRETITEAQVTKKDLDISIANGDVATIRKDVDEINGVAIPGINSQLETKANLNSVFTMANMGQDVKEAMTGGSVAVVGKDTILTENIVNNQISREKNNYYTIEDTNIITKFGYKRIQDKYYSPSNGVTDRVGYSYYHMIPLLANTTYYTLATDIILFDVNKVNPRVITGNLGATTSFTTTASEVYLCLNYGSTPTFIQPGTDGYFLSTKNGAQTRKIYDNELLIKDSNFSDLGKPYSELVTDVAKLSATNGKNIPCKMISNYKAIYDFTNITTNNVSIKKSNKTNMSKDSIYAIATNSGTCTIKKVFDTPINKDEFESISTSLYVPWETLDSASTTGAYIRILLNDSVNSSTGLNGRVFAGWNVVKIDKDEFDIAKLPSTITSITYTIIPRSNVQSGGKFGEFYFDSIVINMRMKPTVIISFDQIWQESIDNGAFDLMYNKGLPYSMYTEYGNLTQNQMNVINKHKNLCEFSLYGSISRNVPVSQIQTELNNATNLGEDIVKQPFSTYAVSQTIITDKDVCALSRTNLKLARLIQDSIPIGYFDNNNILCISVSIDQKTSTYTKAIIDRAIKYGSVASLFLHGVRNDGNESTSISGKGMDLTEFTSAINYIEQLRNDGTINVMTYREFVGNCTSV